MLEGHVTGDDPSTSPAHSEPAAGRSVTSRAGDRKEQVTGATALLNRSAGKSMKALARADWLGLCEQVRRWQHMVRRDDSQPVPGAAFVARAATLA